MNQIYFTTGITKNTVQHLKLCGNSNNEDFITVWLCRYGFNQCKKATCRDCSQFIVCDVSRYEFDNGNLYSINCKDCDNKFFCMFVNVFSELSY